MPAHERNAAAAAQPAATVEAAALASTTDAEETRRVALRVRELAKACGEAWLATEAGGAPA